MTLTRRRFLTISAVAAIAGVHPAAATPQHWQGRALGADIRLQLVGAPDSGGRIWRKVARLLQRMEAQFSLFTESDLARLNANGRLTRPTPDMQKIVALAAQVHDATGGAFDPTVQPLWQAIAHGENPGPARAAAGWQKVRFSESEIALQPGMALTFNGIAQGLTADRLADLMRAEGYHDVLIDAGEIQALGRNGSMPWNAGIAAPDGKLLHRTTLADRALATSSPMGTRIGSGQAHILHPGGRGPLWSTVSVSAPSAALADALSTGFCLMTRPEIDAALGRFAGARLEYLG